MRFVAASVRKDLVRQVRDPLVLLVWIAIPVLIGVLMKLAAQSGSGGPPRVRVLVADEDDSFVSRLLQRASAAELFEIEPVELAEGRARIDAGDGSALLVVPRGTAAAVLAGEPATVTLYTNPVERVLPRIAEEAARAAVDLVFYAQQLSGPRLRELATRSDDEVLEALDAELELLRERAAGTLFPPLLSIEDAGPSESGSPSQAPLAVLFPGFLMLAVCFMAEGFSSDLWQERENGTLARALATPRGGAPLLVGKVLAGGVLMAFVSAVAALLGGVLYSLEAPALLLVAVATPVAGVVFHIGFLALHAHAASRRAGNVLGSLLLFPLLMAGGSFFPFESMPAWLASIGRATPNGLVLDRVRDVAFGDAGPMALVFPAVALALLGGAFSWLLLRRLPRFVLS